VVTLKYVLVITRVDNRGEGGVLALSTLALQGTRSNARRRAVALALGMTGVALFYGDGLITPAISVLSAVEGLKVATPVFDPWILPVSVAILLGLFLVQRRGTGRVGRLFGPVMVLWFLVIGLLGLVQIIQVPQVLEALSPLHAVAMFEVHGLKAFIALGAVVLAITGAEALYADLGHFGRVPIRVVWLGLVLPALLLNYFGQGALLLSDPASAANPFYYLAPEWGLYPLVVLATVATVIASQAVITGAFSLTRQAIQMGLLPRMTIRHTSEQRIGQVYIPAINWMLLTGVLVLVLEFRSSTSLAAAYGIAVTGVMAVTTALAFLVYRHKSRWPLAPAAVVFGFFLVIDLVFFGSAALKIPQGGWMPLLVAGVLFILMMVWRRGRRILSRKLYSEALPMEIFVRRLIKKPQVTVPGTAVFMTANPDVVPRALLHNLKHNKVLHERNILMTVTTAEVPRIPDSERIQIRRIDERFHAVTARYGFAEQPDVPEVLRMCGPLGLETDIMETSFFLNRETLVPTADRYMPLWQDWVFISMAAFAADATGFFRIPQNRVVEMGTQINI
nr:potassium transporter Kup [Pseudomonadota bacterium]